MNTNSYFIEYLVAGTLTVIWFVFLSLGVVGIKWLEMIAWKNSFIFEGENLFAVIVVLFPVIYVIGIVTDRLVDHIFDHFFTAKKLKKYFKDQHEYDKAVTKLFLTSVELSHIYSSTRMRIGIVRTATFSILMTIISIHVFIWGSGIYSNPEMAGFHLGVVYIDIWKRDLITFSVMLSILMSIACYTAFRAWNLLLDSEYTRLLTRVHCIDELKEEEMNIKNLQ